MISCTEFIPAYSELFKFIHQQEGLEGVRRFWASLADAFLSNLRNYAQKRGVEGCFEYWSHTLTEEAADFHMEYDPDADTLRIDMRHCPSRGRLNEIEHIEPYEFYCDHCPVLYDHVLRPLGYEFTMDLTHCHEARCSALVRPLDSKQTPHRSDRKPRVLDAKAADNQYLHKDFHGALCYGIKYLDEHYGPQAVEAYLRQVAQTYYLPLTQKVKKTGLSAMADYLKEIFDLEGGQYKLDLDDESLRVDVSKCPAIDHLRRRNLLFTEKYCLTTVVVYKTICEAAGCNFTCDYQPGKGQCQMQISRT